MHRVPPVALEIGGVVRLRLDGAADLLRFAAPAHREQARCGQTLAPRMLLLCEVMLMAAGWRFLTRGTRYTSPDYLVGPLSGAPPRLNLGL